ncbi:NADPH-dependent FMN reductase [Pseudonocardia adelaidensis]|uniref:NAD(P)H-dependent oxidoreductase n=1 Tax=Pseudonocardia adelaidensis TaxID=648754 RepID=A0ABP9NL96_9PSEU
MDHDEDRPVLEVIIGSTRPGRAGLPVGRWIAEYAAKTGRFEVEIVDLAEIGLPMLDEPNHPGARQYTKGHTEDFSAIISRADAFVLVTPEYNHGYPAPVKNALDFLLHEWAHKPIGLVSYGGVSGGVRAVHALKPVLAFLKMIPVAEGVIIPFVSTFIEGSGDERRFVPNEVVESSADAMLAAISTGIPAVRMASAGQG